MIGFDEVMLFFFSFDRVEVSEGLRAPSDDDLAFPSSLRVSPSEATA